MHRADAASIPLSLTVQLAALRAASTTCPRPSPTRKPLTSSAWKPQSDRRSASVARLPYPSRSYWRTRRHAWQAGFKPSSSKGRSIPASRYLSLCQLGKRTFASARSASASRPLWGTRHERSKRRAAVTRLRRAWSASSPGKGKTSICTLARTSQTSWPPSFPLLVRSASARRRCPATALRFPTWLPNTASPVWWTRKARRSR